MPQALWRTRLSTANGSSSGTGRSPADSPASQLSQAPQGGSNRSPKQVRSSSRRAGGGPARQPALAVVAGPAGRLERLPEVGQEQLAAAGGGLGVAAQHLDAGLLAPAVVLGQGGRGRHRTARPRAQGAG